MMKTINGGNPVPDDWEDADVLPVNTKLLDAIRDYIIFGCGIVVGMGIGWLTVDLIQRRG